MAMDDEQQRATQSINRGRLAGQTMPPGSPEQQKYIAEQGQAESGGGARLYPDWWKSMKEARVQSKTDADLTKGLAGIGK